MITTETTLLRNTISGVTASFNADYARDLLAHPHYGSILVEVDSEKPEVLSAPYVIESGERQPADAEGADDEDEIED